MLISRKNVFLEVDPRTIHHLLRSGLIIALQESLFGSSLQHCEVFLFCFTTEKDLFSEKICPLPMVIQVIRGRVVRELDSLNPKTMTGDTL